MLFSIRLDRFVIFDKPRARKQTVQLTVERGIISARRRRIGNDYRLTSRYRIEPSLHRGAQSALDLVAHDRFSDFVGNGKTHPHRPRGCKNQYDVRFGQALTVSVNVRERTVFIQSVRFIKQLFAERRGRKILSALVATVFEYASAALRLHSLTKTVNFTLLTFFGLISSFHDVLRKSRFSPR